MENNKEKKMFTPKSKINVFSTTMTSVKFDDYSSTVSETEPPIEDRTKREHKRGQTILNTMLKNNLLTDTLPQINITVFEQLLQNNM